MTKIAPRKRKTAAGSLRKIARRLGIRYDHTKNSGKVRAGEARK